MTNQTSETSKLTAAGSVAAIEDAFKPVARIWLVTDKKLMMPLKAFTTKRSANDYVALAIASENLTVQGVPLYEPSA